MTITRTGALLLIVSVLVPVGAVAARAAAGKPAIEMKSNLAGKKVIATPQRLGIYYWDTEKAVHGKIRCTGKCAAAWPPVFVSAKVPKHVAGVMATFGTVQRGKRLQLTVNGLPAYTFHGDKPGFVGCDGVDGWHAVRAG